MTCRSRSSSSTRKTPIRAGSNRHRHAKRCRSRTISAACLDCPVRAASATRSIFSWPAAAPARGWWRRRGSSRARRCWVDLSLASLAYARRQVEALGLDNVEFAEADILNMGTMDRTFDIVDASGVLHHLSDPWAGWRALLARLRAGGFMEVCLYSALARRDINAARAFVAERGYRPSAPDIRRCRQDILASATAWAKRVANCRDFFTTSECRDLLLHVQEHQMALPQIAAFLAESNADFIGFNDPRVLAQFKARFPAEHEANDLGLWHLFETENPDTFIEMYCLWMRKRA